MLFSPRFRVSTAPISEQKNKCSSHRTTPPIFLCPHPPPVNHPSSDKPPPRGFYTRNAWQKHRSGFCVCAYVCVCVYCMWAGGVCQSGYPLRLSKRLMGNLLHGPNHRVSLSFQQISLFSSHSRKRLSQTVLSLVLFFEL